jgi:8-oxo-dGTP pyrophosphatase MutT (NUDIX family)
MEIINGNIVRKSVKVVLLDQSQRVLLLHRSSADPYRPSTMDLPGGEVNPNEDPINAAIRETFEETAIRLPSDWARLIWIDRRLSQRGNHINLRGIIACQLDEPAPSVQLDPIEHDWYGWRSRSEAVLHLGHPVMREAIVRELHNRVVQQALLYWDQTR